RGIQLLSQTIEFIHNASLLHDDLIDRSSLRRGKTTAWLKCTPEYAVLAGDYLLARVMVNLSAYGNIRLVQYTSQVISDLLEGEWIQDSLVRDFSVVPDQLDRVHNLKTASLFKWCLRSPFLVKEKYDESLHSLLEEMGSLLGILFQRSDDLLDFDVRNHEGKAILGDLKSGYLNSFAAFLTEHLTVEEKKKFITSQSLGELIGVVGEEKYKSLVEKFDSMNSGLIRLYQHHLTALEEMLEGSEKKLVEKLRPLPDLLYWRKEPK
ncbi:MAG: polyprenyl synthetase family protein, partial [Pseudobdellovibrionaceae bacterium]